MVYTLSSPSVLASDVACHPCAGEVLAALSQVFRLTERGVTQLGLCALDADPVRTAVAWGMVELLDMVVPSTSAMLRASTTTGLPDAAALARTRLGDVRDVTRLVVVESARWPEGAGGVVAGGATVPPSAAAAAALVCARWATPELPAEHVAALVRPWGEMCAREPDACFPADISYGPRSSAVADLRDTVARGGVGLEALGDVDLPPQTWVTSMHAAARAAHTTGRLRAQLLAVMDVTAALVRSLVDPDPVLLRAALPALHALTVATVVGDVLDSTPLARLRRADSVVV